jgi:GntR family transcriptional regulator, transcriptional repressor for pyruvate dehydrogenase complex
VGELAQAEKQKKAKARKAAAKPKASKASKASKSAAKPKAAKASAGTKTAKAKAPKAATNGGAPAASSAPSPKLSSRRRPSHTKPKKTAILVAQRIVDEILEQELEAGAALLPERVMLPRYGVARGTLREALRILETYGLISIKTGPGGGPVVADAGSRPLASVIALVLQMDRASFRSIVDARLALEPLLAREAAERRDQADLDALAASIEEMRDVKADAGEFLDRNHVFHSAVAAASKNPVLYNMVASLNWIIDGTAMGIDYAPETRDAIVAAHRRIFVAIEAGDTDMAEAAMRIHIGEFAAHAERNYAHVLDQPLRWDQVDT